MAEPLSQRREHLLHAVYYLQVEQGQGEVPRDDPEVARHNGEATRSLAGEGLLEEADGRLRLTEAGAERARDVVRRHRLAERLMADVLGMPPDSGEYIASEMEHIVSPELAGSICTLLGHPTECPHHNPIPPGPCCREGAASVGPAVVALSDMKAGDTGTVAYITSRPGPVRGRRRRWGEEPAAAPHGHRGGGPPEPGGPRGPGGRRIGQMASLGLFPGQGIEVLQTSPTYVLRVGGTTLALDTELAGCIRVRYGEGRGDGGKRG
jgi:DtxR family Mn-dependent transcriptional regulator